MSLKQYEISLLFPSSDPGQVPSPLWALIAFFFSRARRNLVVECMIQWLARRTPPTLPSLLWEKQKLNKSYLQPGRPFHIGWINRNSIFPRTSPTPAGSLQLWPVHLCCLSPIMMADPHRGQGVPSNTWQNCRGGGLLLLGSHNLIGSCSNKLSLKW